MEMREKIVAIKYKKKRLTQSDERLDGGELKWEGREFGWAKIIREKKRKNEWIIKKN